MEATRPAGDRRGAPGSVLRLSCPPPSSDAPGLRFTALCMWAPVCLRGPLGLARGLEMRSALCLAGCQRDVRGGETTAGGSQYPQPTSHQAGACTVSLSSSPRRRGSATRSRGGGRNRRIERRFASCFGGEHHRFASSGCSDRRPPPLLLSRASWAWRAAAPSTRSTARRPSGQPRRCPSARRRARACPSERGARRA